MRGDRSRSRCRRPAFDRYDWRFSCDLPSRGDQTGPVADPL